jgi:diadenosine tetraphosphatase ApaH/serine/threonine PP2A family protein phosphatase
MRIGIFSDVHSNIEALTVVTQFYEQLDEPVDMYVCLGDVVGYGANPNECAEVVRELAEYTILGNHDAAVCGRMNYQFYYDAARNALDWHAGQLKEHHHEWLKTLPYREDYEDFSFCHGSPVNLEDFEYVFNLHQASQLLPHWEDLQWVTFIGHSHLTKAFSLEPSEGAVEVSSPMLSFDRDKKYIVTVGSVGQPRDNDNRACCCIFDTDEATLSYHRLTYDIREAARKIFASDLSSDFAKRLFFGI